MADGHTQRVLPTMLSAGAVGLAAAHLIWPDLHIDTITVVLLVVATVPWLGSVFDSIELPGGGMVRYRQLEQRVADAAQTAQAALGAASTGPGSRDPAADAKVVELAAKYAELRALTEGPARSEAMNRLVGELMAWTVRAAGFVPSTALQSADPGTRLAAYACLFATADARYLPQLVDALVDVEDKPFSQYWGIRAAGALLQSGAGSLPPGAAVRLRIRYADLPRASSRRMELERVLSES